MWCIKKLQNWNLNWATTRICIFSWSPIWWIHKTVCKSWRHVCKKSAKKRVISECLAGEFDFLLIEAALPRLFKKDEADSFHRWTQYNALPGRIKGCYSFRYPNKVQLRFWLIQIFFGSLILEKSMYPHYARCTVNRSYEPNGHCSVYGPVWLCRWRAVCWLFRERPMPMCLTGANTPRCDIGHGRRYGPYTNRPWWPLFCKARVACAVEGSFRVRSMPICLFRGSSSTHGTGVTW